MYRNSGQQHKKIQLWGGPASLWTGRVRAYFIKKGIDYQEIRPAIERYRKEIFPKLGYFAIPVTELEDGTIIQDGTDTMEYFESRYPERPMIPKLTGTKGDSMAHRVFRLRSIFYSCYALPLEFS